MWLRYPTHTVNDEESADRNRPDDTPGVRTLRPDVDAQTLSALFEDVSTLASSCRFRDCCHQDGLGCAVRDQVNPNRLKNYHKMLARVDVTP